MGNFHKSIPNALSLFRAVLCPAIAFLVLNERYVAGLALFLVASITDFLDGYLARRWHAESDFGSFLDPVCDKLFAITFFSLLMTLGACPPWFLGLLIAVTLLQSLGYLMLKLPRAGSGLGVTPLRIGKWNTAIQLVWIAVLLSDLFLRERFPRNFRYSEAFHTTGYLLLAALQGLAFLRYFLRYRHQLLPDLRHWLHARGGT